MNHLFVSGPKMNVETFPKTFAKLSSVIPEHLSEHTFSSAVCNAAGNSFSKSSAKKISYFSHNTCQVSLEKINKSVQVFILGRAQGCRLYQNWALALTMYTFPIS
jgi:hypothetical protein